MEWMIVDAALDNRRLDIVLASHEKVASRSAAQRIIRDQTVFVNEEETASPSSRIVKSGDRIAFSSISRPQTALAPVFYPLDILYEDSYLIVVNKPAGIVVHPGPGHHGDTLVNFLLHHSRLSNKDADRPGIVHRIDKDTSGLLVVAKDNVIHDHLAGQFAERTVKRRYEALVWGVPPQDSGTVDASIGRHRTDRKRFTIRADGKPSLTHWRIIKSFRYLSLLECRLETGRTHQIRVHLNSIGHPLVGDPVYGRYRDLGNRIPEELRRQLKRDDGQALHAKTLGFTHPVSGQTMRFKCPLPPRIQSIVTQLESMIQP
jgi:23S rRNA pseudouridine1911/1915/1917 synthase